VIELVVSEDCHFCEEQAGILRANFAPRDFRIITTGSMEFESYDLAGMVEIVPLVVIRRKNGSVAYAAEGLHAAGELRRIIESSQSPSFNLRRSREIAQEQVSKYAG
jgi:hypothetical protein